MTTTKRTVALLVAVAAAATTNDVVNGANLRQDRGLQTYQQADDYVNAMLAAVNKERAAQGLSALCTNKKLQSAAQRHSDDMATKNYMAHEGSDGPTMDQRVTGAGYTWTAVAENVAAGQVDVAAVMQSWMDSPGHRANILGDYTMFGTAYSSSADTTYKHYWTQDFGSGDSEACDGSSNTNTPAQPPSPSTAQNTKGPVVAGFPGTQSAVQTDVRDD